MSGSDDLFHKRKAKMALDLARRRARRASYDRVLIVCEGAKTEPNYLRNLIDFLELKRMSKWMAIVVPALSV